MTGGESPPRHSQVFVEILQSPSVFRKHARKDRSPGSETSSSSSEDPNGEESGSDDRQGPDAGNAAGSSRDAAPHGAVSRADLTPQRTGGRPARNRRPPGWLVEDGLVSLPSTPSKTSRATGRGKESSTAEAAVRSSAKPNGSTPRRSADTKQLDDDETTGPSTPTRRRPNAANPATSPALRRESSKAGSPLTPTSDRSQAATPKRGPRPIKRPRLDGSSSTPRRKRETPSKGVADSPKQALSAPYIRPTSADYYFAAHTSRRRLQTAAAKGITAPVGGRPDLPALTAKEVSKLSQGFYGQSADPLSPAGLTELAIAHYRRQFAVWTSLLFVGNELLLYGLGSKDRVLEDFAKQRADSGDADVVVVRGRSGARPEDWLSDIEELVELSTTGAVAGGIEGRARRIVRHLHDTHNPASSSSRRRADEDVLAPLILVLHSLDSPALLTPRTRICVQILSSSKHIHIIGSTSHPDSGWLTALTSTSSDKNQLWIDCTTLVPMLDDCLLSGAGVRLGGLPRAFDLRAGGGTGGLTGMGARSTVAAGGPSGQASQPVGGMTSAAEMHGSTGSSAPLLSSTAALHVLRSVTVKARALFLKLASELKSQPASSNTASAQPAASASSFSTRSIPFSRLSHLASRNFIATSEPALRALLVEFTTHGLVRLHRMDSSGSEEEHVALGMRDEAEVSEVMEGVKKL
ncbi:unnamed protein product [Parajaminaea phylloscopi]